MKFVAVTSNHVNEYGFTGLLRGVQWLVHLHHVTLANQSKRTTRLNACKHSIGFRNLPQQEIHDASGKDFCTAGDWNALLGNGIEKRSTFINLFTIWMELFYYLNLMWRRVAKTKVFQYCSITTCSKLTIAWKVYKK